MNNVTEALAGITKLGIDTAPIIYFIESHPAYDSCVTSVFELIANSSLLGITSVITLTEVLTLPIKLGQRELCVHYRELLTTSGNLEMVSIDQEIAENAAILRAKYALRTPDAIQLASAIKAHCEAFLTNDLGLKKVTELKVICLSELTE